MANSTLNIWEIFCKCLHDMPVFSATIVYFFSGKYANRIGYKNVSIGLVKTV